MSALDSVVVCLNESLVEDRALRHLTRPLPIIAALAAFVAISVLYLTSSLADPAGAQQCTPIDPTQPVPSDPCFSAELTGLNKVTFSFEVANAHWLARIHTDRSVRAADGGDDVIFNANANCSGVCTKTIWVDRAGRHRWHMKVIDPSNTANGVFVTTTLEVPPLEIPTLESGGGHVDILNVTDQPVEWSHPGRDDVAHQWFEYGKTGLNQLSGELPVEHTGGTISATSLEDGDQSWWLRYCATDSMSEDPEGLCSGEMKITFDVGPPRFKGQSRIYLDESSTLEERTLEWETVGDYDYALASTLFPAPPSIGFNAPVGDGAGGYVIVGNADSFVIEPAIIAAADPGPYTIHLAACDFGSTDHICSNSWLIEAGNSGTITFEPPNTTGLGYQEGDTLATVDGVEVLAPASGYFAANGNNGNTVSAGGYIGTLYTPHYETISVVIGDATEWEERSISDDFLDVTAIESMTEGGPVDLAHDASGNAWILNEFTTGIDRVAPTGDGIDSFTFPRRSLAEPFRNPLAPDTNPSTSWMTRRADQVTRVGDVMWFGLGGHPSGKPDGIRNRSLILSWDPSKVDDSTTYYDERICAYVLPGNGNRLIGLDGFMQDGQTTIVYTDRGGVMGSDSISSFVVPDGCDNDFDFNNLDKHASGVLQDCSPAERNLPGCVFRAAITGSELRSHIAVDKYLSLGAWIIVWYVDQNGQLGLVAWPKDPSHQEGCPDTGSLISVTAPACAYEVALPDEGIVRKGDLVDVLQRTYPWALQVAEDAVYVGEYADKDVVRFEKDLDCYPWIVAVVPLTCFDELHVPFEDQQVQLHSLAVDTATDRLWFTTTSDNHNYREQDAGGLGFVDIASWTAHAADGVSPIYATTYSDLASYNAGGDGSSATQGLRGVSVDAGTGRVAVADGLRRQILTLTPKPGF